MLHTSHEASESSRRYYGPVSCTAKFKSMLVAGSHVADLRVYDTRDPTCEPSPAPSISAEDPSCVEALGPVHAIAIVTDAVVVSSNCTLFIASTAAQGLDGSREPLAVKRLRARQEAHDVKGRVTCIDARVIEGGTGLRISLLTAVNMFQQVDILNYKSYLESGNEEDTRKMSVAVFDSIFKSTLYTHLGISFAQQLVRFEGEGMHADNELCLSGTYQGDVAVWSSRGQGGQVHCRIAAHRPGSVIMCLRVIPSTIGKIADGECNWLVLTGSDDRSVTVSSLQMSTAVGWAYRLMYRWAGANVALSRIRSIDCALVHGANGAASLFVAHGGEDGAVLLHRAHVGADLNDFTLLHLDSFHSGHGCSAVSITVERKNEMDTCSLTSFGFTGAVVHCSVVDRTAQPPFAVPNGAGKLRCLSTFRIGINGVACCADAFVAVMTEQNKLLIFNAVAAAVGDNALLLTADLHPATPTGRPCVISLVTLAGGDVVAVCVGYTDGSIVTRLLTCKWESASCDRIHCSAASMRINGSVEAFRLPSKVTHLAVIVGLCGLTTIFAMCATTAQVYVITPTEDDVIGSNCLTTVASGVDVAASGFGAFGVAPPANTQHECTDMFMTAVVSKKGAIELLWTLCGNKEFFRRSAVESLWPKDLVVSGMRWLPESQLLWLVAQTGEYLRLQLSAEECGGDIRTVDEPTSLLRLPWEASRVLATDEVVGGGTAAVLSQLGTELSLYVCHRGLWQKAFQFHDMRAPRLVDANVNVTNGVVAAFVAFSLNGSEVHVKGNVVCVNSNTGLSRGYSCTASRVWAKTTVVQPPMVEGKDYNAVALYESRSEKVVYILSGGETTSLQVTSLRSNVDEQLTCALAGGHSSNILGVCAFDLDGQVHVATVGSQATVLLWRRIETAAERNSLSPSWAIVSAFDPYGVCSSGDKRRRPEDDAANAVPRFMCVSAATSDDSARATLVLGSSAGEILVAAVSAAGVVSKAAIVHLPGDASPVFCVTVGRANALLDEASHVVFAGDGKGRLHVATVVHHKSGDDTSVSSAVQTTITVGSVNNSLCCLSDVHSLSSQWSLADHRCSVVACGQESGHTTLVTVKYNTALRQFSMSPMITLAVGPTPVRGLQLSLPSEIYLSNDNAAFTVRSGCDGIAVTHVVKIGSHLDASSSLVGCRPSLVRSPGGWAFSSRYDVCCGQGMEVSFCQRIAGGIGI